MKMSVGSLFSGIGGFELGFENTGYFETLWQVENDKYATSVLKKHWPNVEMHDDVRTWPKKTTQPVDVCSLVFLVKTFPTLEGEQD